MSKASNDTLAKLHELVAKKLTSLVKSDECTAQDLAQAIKFLKDNSVLADPELNDAVNRLQDEIDHRKLPFPTN